MTIAHFEPGVSGRNSLPLPGTPGPWPLRDYGFWTPLGVITGTTLSTGRPFSATFCTRFATFFVWLICLSKFHHCWSLPGVKTLIKHVKKQCFSHALGDGLLMENDSNMGPKWARQPHFWHTFALVEFLKAPLGHPFSDLFRISISGYILVAL